MIKNNLMSTRIGLACCGVAAVLPLVGCASRVGSMQDKALVIRWQRLVDDKGKTCDRCGNTEHSIDEAQRMLAASLKPLGMRVQIVKAPLTPEQFKLDPSESNRIWVGDTPLEEILDAKTGDSPCCGSCGDSNCRTMMVDGRTYETIPPELIVRAGLRAAGNLLHPAAAAEPCCNSSDACCESNGSDLQPMAGSRFNSSVNNCLA